tara:strand:- start:185 stop:340 length:156 start_codon:yes stop_codon:yes gene_type:complete
MKPKNGVKIKNRNIEMGSGKFINNNSSTMSLNDYRELANAHQNLAAISMRG